MATTYPILAGHGHALQSGEALSPAAEGAALIMSIVVVLVLVAMAGGILVLVRRARRGESPEQALLREFREESRRKPEPVGEETEEDGDGPKPPAPNWEKDPDWWKDKPGTENDRPEKPD